MIPVPPDVRVWLAVGKTDMRRGMNGLSLQVQETLGRDPFAGDLFVFRGARGDLVKILWHDGLGLSLYAKRLERVPPAWNKAFEVNAADDPAVRASCVEFVLAGLYATDRISRSQRRGQITYEFE